MGSGRRKFVRNTEDSHENLLTLNRGSENDDLRYVQAQRQRDTKLDTLGQPDLDAVNVLPRAECGEGRKTNNTLNGSDLYACSMRPDLVENSVHDECETIQEICERSQRKQKQNESTTRGANSDDDWRDRGGSLRSRRACRYQSEHRQENDGGREHAQDEEGGKVEESIPDGAS